MPIQSNQKSEAKSYEDIFVKLSIYCEMTDLNWLAVVGEVENRVPTRDLV